jgi:asparaginyl-tRNA synthetase
VITNEIDGYEEIIKANVGTSLQIKGTLIKSPAKGQLFELSVCKKDRGHFVKILGSCDAGKYPLAKKRHTQEYLREIAHLRPRTNMIGAMSRVRNNLAFATHQFFQSRGFQYIHTPIITASDCEGAGQMFQVTTILPEPHEKIGKIPTIAPPKAAPVEKKDGEEVKEAAPQFHEKVVNYKKDLFGKPSFLTVSG